MKPQQSKRKRKLAKNTRQMNFNKCKETLNGSCKCGVLKINEVYTNTNICIHCNGVKPSNTNYYKVIGAWEGWVQTTKELPPENGEYLICVMDMPDGKPSYDLAYYDSSTPKDDNDLYPFEGEVAAYEISEKVYWAKLAPPVISTTTFSNHKK